MAGYSRRRRRLQRERVLGGPREVLTPPALYRQVTRPSTRRPTPVSAQRGQGHPDPTTLSPRARRAGGRAGSRRRRRAARGSLGLLFLLRGHLPCSQAGNKGGWLPLRSLLSNDEGSCKRPKAVLSPLAEANSLLAYLTIGHLAGSWFRFLASTFLVGGPQIPKDLGFGGFIPIPVPLVPSIWPENACVMPNSKIRLPNFLPTKIRCNGFF